MIRVRKSLPTSAATHDSNKSNHTTSPSAHSSATPHITTVKHQILDHASEDAKRRAHRWWHSPQNQRQFLESLFSRLKWTQCADYYNLTVNILVQHGGAGLLLHFGNSPFRLLQTVFPEYQWQPWAFVRVPQGFWQYPQNRRAYMDALATTLGFTRMEDWYQISNYTLLENQGAGLLHSFDNSVSKLLATVYPKYDWKMWLFEMPPGNWWDKLKNQRKYADWLGTQLGYSTYEQWYSLRSVDLSGHHGSGILALYHTSPVSFLTSVFPEYPWDWWRFVRAPRGFWQELSSEQFRSVLCEIVKWLETKLNITSVTDWHDVTVMQVSQLVGSGILSRTNGLSGMLRTVYPNHTWIDEDSSLPNTGSNNKWEGRKTQVLLAKVVRSLLPSGTKIYSNYRHKEISLEYSARPLELDVYVPSFRLALEFQGVFHSYSDKPNFFGDPTLQWERDQKKREDCQHLGITLIEVPFTWDGRAVTVAQAIHAVRPDILPHSHPVFHQPSSSSASESPVTQTPSLFGSSSSPELSTPNPGIGIPPIVRSTKPKLRKRPK